MCPPCSLYLFTMGIGYQVNRRRGDGNTRSHFSFFPTWHSKQGSHTDDQDWDKDMEVKLANSTGAARTAIV